MADRHEPENLDLARCESGGPHGRAPASTNLTGRLEHGGNAVGVELSGAHLGSELSGGLICAQSRPVRSVLRHRMERIRRGEDAHGRRLLTGGGAAVVAGAVEPFVVHAGDARHGLERTGAGQDPLRVVRVHPHLFPLGASERGGFPPDRICHRQPADVVEESGDLEPGDRARIQSEMTSGRCGQRRNSA